MLTIYARLFKYMNKNQTVDIYTHTFITFIIYHIKLLGRR